MARAFQWKGLHPPGLSEDLGELSTRLLQAFPLSGEDAGCAHGFTKGSPESGVLRKPWKKTCFSSDLPRAFPVQ